MDFITGEIFYVDKPLHWTSFDVVKRLRGALLHRLHVKKFKVGHAGTLDPLASGVMIVVTGKATKLIDTLQAGVKEYVATVKLGATTPSFDLETEIDAVFPTDHITLELIKETLPRFIGRIEQIPPTFSAVKIGGERAYNFARRGEEIELKPKILVIEELELLEWNPEQMTLTIRIVCSKGTYIRALARDIGEALGTGAHLTALRRTRVGDARIADCLTPDQCVELIRNVRIEYPEDYEGPRVASSPEIRQ